ncbi:MAG: PilZ domain-containing protein [Gammaproteobacteria bacterium]|nr:PilZ domain-containing protein [Gammaproteobacteria bacterium]
MRRYIRHPSDIPIEFEVVGAQQGGNERLTNVSLGGLSFVCSRQVELGSLVRVRISAVQPPFEASAHVRWCKQLQGGGYEVGAELLSQDEAFKTRMVEQVCHIEHYKREVFAREGRQLTGQQAAAEWISRYAASFPRIDQPEAV